MPFISVADEVAKKSFTQVENKFITKYMPVLDPTAVKVYLFAVYLYQRGAAAYTLSDLAETLNMSEDKAKDYFTYLEEFELVAIVSTSPFEVKILDAENVYGTPKKFKPEKYADFTKSVQNIISGRMISTNEFREYFILLDEYGFAQDALLMVINYCVNLKGADIRLQYIKKVAKSFAEEGVTSAKGVEDKLSAYTSSTPALIRLFNAVGIKKKPDIDDDKLYKKWTDALGFEENAIVAAAKQFKIKDCLKLDAVLEELYKNRRLDVKEIESYCKTKNSVVALTVKTAKSLGVYMSDYTPYVENYVNVWCNMGYSFDCIENLSRYCFMNGRNSFADMDTLIKALYNDGIVADESVNEYIEKQNADEKLLKELLAACGLTRKLIPWDKSSLENWRKWNFSDEMLFEAAKLAAGKANPMAYINGILSSWKKDGIFEPNRLAGTRTSSAVAQSKPADNLHAQIEQHYYDLRHAAETRAEKAAASAMSDEIYGKIKKQINELSIQLAFAEISDPVGAEKLRVKLSVLERDADKRLAELKIDKADFTPRYSCKICGDTGYDKDGKPCECMKKFIAEFNK